MNVAVYKIRGQGSVYVRYYLDWGHGQGSSNLSSRQGQGERESEHENELTNAQLKFWGIHSKKRLKYFRVLFRMTWSR